MAANNPLYDAVALLPNDSAAIHRAFDQLSGEIHASAKTALIEDSRYLREAATDRMRAAFGDASAAPAMVAAYGDGGALPVAPTADRPVAWVQGFGAWGNINGDGNAARMTRSIGGFVMGADAPVAGWRLGAIAGYSRNSFNASDRSSSGTSDNYHLGLYGGTQWPVASGKLGLRAGLAYTWHDIGTRRGSPSMATPTAKSSYSAGTFQVFGDLGYRVDMGRVTVEPFVNLAYVNLGTGRFKKAAARPRCKPTARTRTRPTRHWDCARRPGSSWAAGKPPCAARAGATPSAMSRHRPRRRSARAMPTP